MAARAHSEVQSGSTILARGVSSAARLRSRPLVFTSARGVRVTDTSGHDYVDFVLGMGPMLLGHGTTRVLDAAKRQISDGVLFGTTTAEFDLAQRLSELLPHAENVAFVNSGSEGTHLAIRIARATTGRKLILKFEGHYHGWIDPLFINTQNNAASSPEEFPVPLAHGVQALSADDNVVVVRWNDVEELRRTFVALGGSLAAVILEPIPMNFGTLRSAPGYLEELRRLCDESGTLLIFDEVLSGFRLALGGAAALLDVKPDLAVYAKAIASGFPLAVVAGTRQAMVSITSGPIQPAGTYSGNPVAVSAALATLDELEAGGEQMYQRLSEMGEYLRNNLLRVAQENGAPLTVNQVGSVLQLFWGIEGPIHAYADAARSNRRIIAELCESQLAYGSYVSPRGLILLSTQHTYGELSALIDGVERFLLNRQAQHAGKGADL